MGVTEVNSMEVIKLFPQNNINWLDGKFFGAVNGECALHAAGTYSVHFV